MTVRNIASLHHEPPDTTVGSVLFKAIANVLGSAMKQLEYRRAERALREMDPRLLKDIGIERSQIMTAVYTGSGQRRRTYDAL